MSPLAEIHLLTMRELRKSFRSVKGAALAALALAGGAGASMMFVWLDRLRRDHLPAGIDLHDAQEQAFTQAYDADTGKVLADCPYSLFLMLMATLWLGPLLVALMGFDGVAGDRQHRTVRYWAVRARRSSYVLGKYLGGWLSVLAVTLGMNVVVWVVTVAAGHVPASQVLGWGLRFFAVSVPISAAWCAIATLIGSQFRTPMLALLVICAAFFGLWLVRVVAGVADMPGLLYVYPNAYDRFFLSPRPADVARGLLGTCGIAALATAAAVLLFERRDV